MHGKTLGLGFKPYIICKLQVVCPTKTVDGVDLTTFGGPTVYVYFMRQTIHGGVGHIPSYESFCTWDVEKLIDSG